MEAELSERPDVALAVIEVGVVPSHRCRRTSVYFGVSGRFPDFLDAHRVLFLRRCRPVLRLGDFAAGGVVVGYADCPDRPSLPNLHRLFGLRDPVARSRLFQQKRCFQMGLVPRRFHPVCVDLAGAFGDSVHQRRQSRRLFAVSVAA